MKPHPLHLLSCTQMRIFCCMAKGVGGLAVGQDKPETDDYPQSWEVQYARPIACLQSAIVLVHSTINEEFPIELVGGCYHLCNHKVKFCHDSTKNRCMGQGNQTSEFPV